MLRQLGVSEAVSFSPWRREVTAGNPALMRLAHAVFASILMVLCSVSCTQENSRNIHTVIEEIDEDGAPVPSVIGGVSVQVSFIAGSIWGHPQTADILVVPAQMGASLSLDRDRLLEAGSRLASAVAPDASQAGLQVEPRNVRFGRFGTRVSESGSNRSSGATGFLEKQSREFLALLYVDGPCLISGTVQIGDAEGRLRIAMDKAGLHWISIKQLAPDLYEFGNAEPQSVVLGIQPYPVPSIGPAE